MRSEAVLAAELIGNGNVVALSADNGAGWLTADQACSAAEKSCLPLPHFFTPQQMQWALDSAGADILLTDQPELPIWKKAGFSKCIATGSLYALQRSFTRVQLPPDTAKITFTSGSTGNPKGVCLSRTVMGAVSSSIADLMRTLDIRRHLCALPLSILLENIAGADAARLAGADCVTPSLAEVGWSGSSQWNSRTFLQCLVDQRIESVIILPQMLKAMLPMLNQFDTSSLKLVAVGGARVAPALLKTACELGLPVYEGYGLSECGSVVCFNRPGSCKAGTVGKPLPHVSVRISDIGELEVAGNRFSGYLGQSSSAPDEWLQTGDLASIDSEGFVTITGRRKNLIISSFGRNISPEWVESELLVQPGIVQVAVFGEGSPWLVAILFAPGLSDSDLATAVENANENLPDYARVRRHVRATEAFSVSNGLATSNGRNRRNSIADHYQSVIDQLYVDQWEIIA